MGSQRVEIARSDCALSLGEHRLKFVAMRVEIIRKPGRHDVEGTDGTNASCVVPSEAVPGAS